ncbi:DUF6111 family protein [Microvirga antarctica]|uniref:DUF6111 family protein n=1 Tax=Microvirga antarctica TaxID=2819233 RepID=UPI001B30FC59|nr:DUF6111 family protein [Microvirga antarctica]
MTRAIIQELLLFLLPFAAYAIFLVIVRRNPLAWSSWSRHTSWLVLAGLGLIIVSLLAGGFLADRQTGVYVPSHMENGVLVPGHFK